MNLSNDDALLHVETAGDGTHTVILVHGLGGSARTWDSTVPALAQHFRVWCPELRGCGASERGTLQYDLDLLADDLAAIVKAAAKHGPVVLVGHSLGGVVVQALLTRGSIEVDAAALASTSSRLNSAATANWLRIADAVEKKGLSTKPQAQARGFSDAFADAHPEVLAEQAELAKHCDTAVYVEQARAASHYDFDERLGAVAIPVLVIQGLADKMTPVGGSVILDRALPNSRLELIEGVGHNLHIEMGDRFAQLVHDFVRTSCA
ncbi:MAG: pimeloyl-ACP methyl ester carboxylesterase [Hyphomicrobiaceae bacterium]|jgi:pimeloyl-ACP methyl ester carboxylesterase